MKKHILCLGDSNTHGYCADPNDCADHGIRFNEDERWTLSLIHISTPPSTAARRSPCSAPAPCRWHSAGTSLSS